MRTLLTRNLGCLPSDACIKNEKPARIIPAGFFCFQVRLLSQISLTVSTKMVLERLLGSVLVFFLWR